MSKTIGFIGAGKMAEGILAAALRGGTAVSDVIMAERAPARAAEMSARYGVEVVGDAQEAVDAVQ